MMDNSTKDDEAYKVLMQIVRAWKLLGVKILPAGTQRIGHIPHLAPQAYLHDIFIGLEAHEILMIENQIGLPVPNSLKVFYSRHNGVNLFGRFGVYGLRFHYDRANIPSILEQPYDIRTPNILERPRGAPKEIIFIGSLSEEQIYAFAWPDGLVGFWDKRTNKILDRTYESVFQYLARAAQVANAHFDKSGHYLGGNLLAIVEQK